MVAPINNLLVYQKDIDRFIFYCPGCKQCHGVTKSWKVDLRTLTISPSVRVSTTNRQGKEVTICHLFVRNGEIEYLSDSRHELAGKTVPMEPI